LRAYAQIIDNFRRNSFACPWEILSSKMGSWSLASSLLIIVIIKIIYNYIIVTVKNTTVIEKTKHLKAFLGSLFRQPITSHHFWFVQKKYSFGSNLMIIHISPRAFKKIIASVWQSWLEKKWDSSECRMPRKSFLMPLWACLP
jgi:hypothetical protein